jgi:hypothetical protein
MLLLIHFHRVTSTLIDIPLTSSVWLPKFLDYVKRLPLVAFSLDGLNCYAQASPRVAEIC